MLTAFPSEGQPETVEPSPAENLLILLAEKSNDTVISSAREILAVDPHNARALVSLIEALVRLERIDEARRQVGDEDDAVALLGRGKLAALGGEEALAESLFTSSARRFAEDGARGGEMIANEALGVLLDSQRRFEEAIPVLSRAISIAGSLRMPVASRVSHHTLGKLLRDLGRYDEAIEHLRRTISLSESLGAPPREPGSTRLRAPFS